MCKFCLDKVCTNRCKISKKECATYEDIERQLKLKGLEYAQCLGITIEKYQSYFDLWEDAVIGCGENLTLELLPQLKEAIDFQLEMEV